MLRFLTDSSAQASFHVSQFLGTGVVRAYKTERCGIPGLRILLHPDLEPLLDKEAMRIIPAKPGEKMHLSVRSEVNYLDPKTDSHLGKDYDDCLQFDALRWMVNTADEAFHYHYIETFHALNAMRASSGALRIRGKSFWTVMNTTTHTAYVQGRQRRNRSSPGKPYSCFCAASFSRSCSSQTRRPTSSLSRSVTIAIDRISRPRNFFATASRDW